MAKLLLNLRSVPEDEADDVRAMLREHRIEFYETEANRWGLTAGGIWLRHDEDKSHAKDLMADYQARRFAEARAEHERQKREGTAPSTWGLLRRDPAKYLLYLALVGVIIYFSVMPFLNLAR